MKQLKTYSLFCLLIFFGSICFSDLFSEINCRKAFDVKFIEVVKIDKDYVEKSDKPSVQRDYIADSTEIYYAENVKCGYKLERMIGYELGNMLLHSKKCFQSISGRVIISSQVDNSKFNGVNSNSSRKNNSIMHFLNDLFYVWENGSCSDKSAVYFKDVNGFVNKDDLKKNNFLEVIVSDSETVDVDAKTEYKMYYANPGFLIKTKKCSIKDKCKNKDLLVVYKKRLSDAILKKNVVLTTDTF